MKAGRCSNGSHTPGDLDLPFAKGSIGAGDRLLGVMEVEESDSLRDRHTILTVAAWPIIRFDSGAGKKPAIKGGMVRDSAVWK